MFWLFAHFSLLYRMTNHLYEANWLCCKRCDLDCTYYYQCHSNQKFLDLNPNLIPSFCHFLTMCQFDINLVIYSANLVLKDLLTWLIRFILQNEIEVENLTYDHWSCSITITIQFASLTHIQNKISIIITSDLHSFIHVYYIITHSLKLHFQTSR